MMVRYRSRAQKDIESIYDNIARDNLGAAQRVEDAIHAAGDLLSKRPEIGVVTGHKDARRWPMTTFDYTLFYRIEWDEGYVDVLRVVRSRRVQNLKRVP